MPTPRRDGGEIVPRFWVMVCKSVKVDHRSRFPYHGPSSSPCPDYHDGLIIIVHCDWPFINSSPQDPGSNPTPWEFPRGSTIA